MTAANPGGGVYRPLSFNEEAIWYEQQFQARGSNLGAITVGIGGLDDDALVHRTCLEVVRRHEPLRSVVVETPAGPRRLVLDAEQLFDYATGDEPCPPGDERAAARARLRRDYYTGRPWDLATGSPIRFLLLRHGPGRRTLVIAIHHICFDGRSKFIFATDFARILTAVLSGADPDLEPVAYPGGPLGPLPDELAQDYWRGLEEQPAQWPVALPAPLPGHRGQEGEVQTTGRRDLAGPQRDRLRALARAQGGSLFSAVLACLAVQLRAYGNDVPVVSVSVSLSTPETAGLIGTLVNVVPVTLQPRPDWGIGELLTASRERVRRLDAVRRLPLRSLLRSKGLLGAGRTPFSAVGVSYQRVVPEVPAVPGVTLDWDFFSPNTASSFDLTLQLREEPSGLYGRVDYVTEACDEGAAAAVLDHLVAVCEQVAAGGARTVGDLDPFAGSPRAVVASRGLAVVGPDDRVLPQRVAGDLARLDGDAQPVRTGQRAAVWPGDELAVLGPPGPTLVAGAVRCDRADVEAVLCRHPLVTAAAVVPGPRGDALAFVEPTGGGGVSTAAVQAFVRRTLPAALVPQRVVVVDRLPRLADGCLDRAALEAWEAGRAGEPPDLGALGDLLAAMWQDVLEVPLPGAGSDFFHLGGHSLLATRVLGRIREELGVELSLQDFVTHPTLADLTALVEAALLDAAGELADPAAAGSTVSHDHKNGGT